MERRHVLHLSVQSAAHPSSPDERFPDGAVIAINGRDLLDIVREIEAPFAAAEGHAGLAGSYCPIPASVAFLPSRHLLGSPDALYSELVTRGEATKAAVLVCECGEPGCWPLCARIEVGHDVVVWSDFEQPHRSREAWSYEGLGPFVFERVAYERALRPPPDSAP